MNWNRKVFNSANLDESGYYIVMELLNEIGVPYTKSFIRKFLFMHPNFQSLLSISDLLNVFRVDNMVLNLTGDRLKQLPFPVILRIVDVDRSATIFVMVKHDDGETIEYVSPLAGTISESHEEFSSKWDGNALLVEKQSDSAEPAYATNKADDRAETKAKHLFQVLLLLLFIGVLFNAYVNNEVNQIPIWISIAVLKAVGIFVSILLVKKDYGGKSVVANNLCNIKNTKLFNCDSVLGSRLSQLFGVFKLSELGLLYFGGGFVLICAFPHVEMNHHYSWLALIQLLALLFSIFAFLYQVKVVRRVCTLCLGVQAVLWLELPLYLSYLKAAPNGFFLESVPILGVVFCFGLLALLMVRDKFILANEMPLIKRKLNFFLYDFDVMDRIVRGRSVVKREVLSGDINLGDKTAHFESIAILNLNCPHCKEVFDVLLLLTKSIRFKLTIRLVSNDDLMSREVHRHILAFKRQRRDISILQECFKNSIDYELLVKRFPIEYDETYQESISDVAALNRWANSKKIHATPTIFLDGFEVPSELSISDLQSYIHTAAVSVKHELSLSSV